MMGYFGLIMTFVARYEPRAGVDAANSVAFLAFWSRFFFLWTFIPGFPFGPATPTYYNPA